MEPMPARPGSSPQEKLGVFFGGVLLLILIILLCKASGVVPVKPTCPTVRQCDPATYPAACPSSGCCPTNTVWDTVQNCCTDKYGICAPISCSNPSKCKLGAPPGDPYACCPGYGCYEMKCVSSVCLPFMRCDHSAYPLTCPPSACCPKKTVWDDIQKCCVDGSGACVFICPFERECDPSAYPDGCPPSGCCPDGTVWNTTQNCCTDNFGVCVSFCPMERICNPAANPATCPPSGCCPDGTTWGASGSSPEPCCLDSAGQCPTTPPCPAKRMCSHFLYPTACPSSGCCPTGTTWNASQKCCTNSAGVCVFECPAERTCDPVSYPATCPSSGCCPSGSAWNTTQNCCTDSYGTCVHCANPYPCNSSALCCPGYTCNSTTERCELQFAKFICTHHPSNCVPGPYNESNNETCCPGFYCNPDNGLCCKEGWGCSYSAQSCYWGCNGQPQAPYPDCSCDCTGATCEFGGTLDEYCVCHCSNDCHGGTYNMDCSCNCGDPARQQEISETMCNSQPIHITTDCSCNCQNPCNETGGGKRNDTNCQCDCSGVACPQDWAVNATDCTCYYVPPLCSDLGEGCTQNEDCCGYAENTQGYGYDAACYGGTCQNCTLTYDWGCGIDSMTGEVYRSCCNPSDTCDASNTCTPPSCIALDSKPCGPANETQCCYYDEGAFCYLGSTPLYENKCYVCLPEGANCYKPKWPYRCCGDYISGEYYAGVCINKICTLCKRSGVIGECAINDECCYGYTCDGTGACVTTGSICKDAGVSCSSDEECCSGWCTTYGCLFPP
ncbi:MAG: hypothetical protein AB1468_00725 [Candidatus Micrarchaeota archaeon]